MTNRKRIENARKAFDAYKALPGLDTGDDATTMVDLIGDLMHMAGTLDTEMPLFDGDEAVARATYHYHAERRFGLDEETE